MKLQNTNDKKEDLKKNQRKRQVTYNEIIVKSRPVPHQPWGAVMGVAG